MLRIVLGLVLASLPVLFARPSAASEPDEQNSIHSGATSLQLLTFGGYGPAFGTSGIFLRSHFSDRGAIRIGADFYLNEVSQDGDINTYPWTRHTDSHAFTVSAQLDQFVDARGPVTAFVGLGPYWARSQFFAEENRPTTYGIQLAYNYYKSKETSWTVGAAAAAGFEWFFKRKLSVIGRVGGSFGIGKARTEEVYRTTDAFGTVLNDDQYRLNSNTASASTASAGLGLGVYF